MRACVRWCVCVGMCACASSGSFRVVCVVCVCVRARALSAFASLMLLCCVLLRLLPCFLFSLGDAAVSMGEPGRCGSHRPKYQDSCNAQDPERGWKSNEEVHGTPGTKGPDTGKGVPAGTLNPDEVGASRGLREGQSGPPLSAVCFLRFLLVSPFCVPLVVFFCAFPAPPPFAPPFSFWALPPPFSFSPLFFHFSLSFRVASSASFCCLVLDVCFLGFSHACRLRWVRSLFSCLSSL